MIPDYYDYCDMHEADEAKYERWLIEHSPKCECCGEPILDEDAYYIDDIWYCEDCIFGARTTVRRKEWI